MPQVTNLSSFILKMDTLPLEILAQIFEPFSFRELQTLRIISKKCKQMGAVNAYCEYLQDNIIKRVFASYNVMGESMLDIITLGGIYITGEAVLSIAQGEIEEVDHPLRIFTSAEMAPLVYEILNRNFEEEVYLENGTGENVVYDATMWNITIPYDTIYDTCVGMLLGADTYTDADIIYRTSVRSFISRAQSTVVIVTEVDNPDAIKHAMLERAYSKHLQNWYGGDKQLHVEWPYLVDNYIVQGNRDSQDANIRLLLHCDFSYATVQGMLNGYTFI